MNKQIAPQQTSAITVAVKKQQTGAKQLDRFKRILILRTFMEQQSNKNLSFADLAALMREHPWVSERWPSYSASTAHRDFEKSMELIRDDVKELSMLYFSRQVELLDDVIDELYELTKDANVDVTARISAANSLRGYLDTSIKIFGNYMPKQINMSKATVEFTIDDFFRAKEEADAHVQVIDSYVVEDE